MSTKRLLDDNDYLSSRLIHFIHTQAKINPNGAVIAPMKWIEATQGSLSAVSETRPLRRTAWPEHLGKL
jgi:hypothetical protein